MTKINLKEERDVLFCFTCPDHAWSWKEVRVETQAEAEVGTMGGIFLVTCILWFAHLQFLPQPYTIYHP